MTPWTHQRQWWPLHTLVRVIDLEAERQEFVVLAPISRRDLSDLEFDGQTFIYPNAERSQAAQAAIVEQFDRLYLQDPPDNKQTRISALSRERFGKKQR